MEHPSVELEKLIEDKDKLSKAAQDFLNEQTALTEEICQEIANAASLHAWLVERMWQNYLQNINND